MRLPGDKLSIMALSSPSSRWLDVVDIEGSSI
jgi:hypothetical protein